jgi:hypothetical protein
MDYFTIVKVITTILIFLILVVIGKIIYKKLKNSDSRLLNPTEYLPEDEVVTLRQVFYLVMMLLFFIFTIYTLIITSDKDIILLAWLEAFVLLYVSVTLDYTTWKNRLLFLLLIPYGVISYYAFGSQGIAFLDLFHVLAYIYLIKVYYTKFKTFTETNSLGITIILLFAIIFISFIVTSIVEGVGPLNAMVMVSNAFTSNGYAILGNSSVGKLNSIFLVWGGYILSGAGTATLTAAIMTKQFNKKFDKLEELIKENNK